MTQIAGQDRKLPPVAVLILNWNGWPDVLECLESVLRLDYPDFHVIVCDNGSTDGSVGHVLDWAAGRLDAVPQRREMEAYMRPPVKKPVAIRVLDRAEAEHGAEIASEAVSVTLISNGANLGFAGGNNVGLRHALARGFDRIWLLNADTVVPPGALRPLVARMEGDTAGGSAIIGMCGSMLCYYAAPEVIEEAGGCAYYPLLGMARWLKKDEPVGQVTDWRRVERRLGYVSAASCLVRGSLIRDIGPMAEDYFLYCEEIDWATRAKGRYRLAFAPDSIVYHKKGRSTGSKTHGARRSAGSAYYLWRARHRFTRRYHPFGLPALLSLGVLAAIREYAVGEKPSAGAILRGVFNRS